MDAVQYAEERLSLSVDPPITLRTPFIVLHIENNRQARPKTLSIEQRGLESHVQEDECSIDQIGYIGDKAWQEPIAIHSRE